MSQRVAIDCQALEGKTIHTCYDRLPGPWKDRPSTRVTIDCQVGGRTDHPHVLRSMARSVEGQTIHTFYDRRPGRWKDRPSTRVTIDCQVRGRTDHPHFLRSTDRSVEGQTINTYYCCEKLKICDTGL
ncbi:hypothetical protein LSAT2_003341 [Lamellibrachia satsuma]|nr:hypothetical protein LSAT2_003341 [Lamellibrachia satsuma]